MLGFVIFTSLSSMKITINPMCVSGSWTREWAGFMAARALVSKKEDRKTAMTGRLKSCCYKKGERGRGSNTGMKGEGKRRRRSTRRQGKPLLLALTFSTIFEFTTLNQPILYSFQVQQRGIWLGNFKMSHIPLVHHFQSFSSTSEAREL